jgi:Spy/CpxP family protein refolding chaperone
VKIKFMPVLARAFSLAQSGATAAKRGAIAAIAATAITMTPVMVKAQGVPFAEIFPLLSGIELTAQQKIQLADLGSQALTQMEQIVTQEQRNQFRTALADGKGFGAALAAMNITSQQQTQLQGVFRSAQTQLISTLTPTQRQQILQNMRTLLQLQ